MCTAIVLLDMVRGCPVVVGFNRDERFSRQSGRPTLHLGEHRVVAPVDLRSGGTWIGVNSGGLLVAVLNSTRRRHRGSLSRGQLVLDLLKHHAGAESLGEFLPEIELANYSASFLLAADKRHAELHEIGRNPRSRRLASGVHVICDSAPEGANCTRGRWLSKGLSGLIRGGSLKDAINVLASMLSEHDSCASRAYTTCCHDHASGTVSSQIAILRTDGCPQFLHQNGPPCRAREYSDFSDLL